MFLTVFYLLPLSFVSFFLFLTYLSLYQHFMWFQCLFVLTISIVLTFKNLAEKTLLPSFSILLQLIQIYFRWHYIVSGVGQILYNMYSWILSLFLVIMLSFTPIIHKLYTTITQYNITIITLNTNLLDQLQLIKLFFSYIGSFYYVLLFFMEIQNSDLCHCHSD